jgi:hypothetical protein
MDVPHLYVPMRAKRDDMRGFSESELKKRLEKQGWTVWRGELIILTRTLAQNTLEQRSARRLIRNALEEKEESSVLHYPSVRRKYERLLQLLVEDFAEQLEVLQYLCAIHHGIPDYLCYRKKDGKKEWKFVECKLMHEQLLPGQKACIPKLQQMGFHVEVHKLIDYRTKTRRAGVDLKTGTKKILEKQMKLPRRTAKWKLGSANLRVRKEAPAA